MKTEIERKKEKLGSLVLRPDETPEAKKPLVGMSTGTFLDQLFLMSDGEPLNGVSICGQFAITGLPGAGKSILVEEIAVRVAAAGKKALFATVEDTMEMLRDIVEETMTSRDDEGMHVKPSVVVEATYQEIQKTDEYTSGYALRVPKIVRFRPDKGVQEIDNIKKLHKLYDMQYERHPFKSL